MEVARLAPSAPSTSRLTAASAVLRRSPAPRSRHLPGEAPSTHNSVVRCRQPLGRATALAASASDGAAPSSTACSKLILYTKADCPLCQGLQEKVTALLARAEFMPCTLAGVTLEVRDVSTRPEWSQKYAMEVPVLAALQGGGGGAGPATEVELPRPPPRITADRLQKHIESAMQALSL